MQSHLTLLILGTSHHDQASMAVIIATPPLGCHGCHLHSLSTVAIAIGIPNQWWDGLPHIVSSLPIPVLGSPHPDVVGMCGQYMVLLWGCVSMVGCSH